jgi:hypothetical protein
LFPRSAAEPREPFSQATWLTNNGVHFAQEDLYFPHRTISLIYV